MNINTQLKTFQNSSRSNQIGTDSPKDTATQKNAYIETCKLNRVKISPSDIVPLNTHQTHDNETIISTHHDELQVATGPQFHKKTFKLQKYCKKTDDWYYDKNSKPIGLKYSQAMNKAIMVVQKCEFVKNEAMTIAPKKTEKPLINDHNTSTESYKHNYKLFDASRNKHDIFINISKISTYKRNLDVDSANNRSLESRFKSWKKTYVNDTLIGKGDIIYGSGHGEQKSNKFNRGNLCKSFDSEIGKHFNPYNQSGFKKISDKDPMRKSYSHFIAHFDSGPTGNGCIEKSLERKKDDTEECMTRKTEGKSDKGNIQKKVENTGRSGSGYKQFKLVKGLVNGFNKEFWVGNVNGGQIGKKKYQTTDEIVEISKEDVPNLLAESYHSDTKNEKLDTNLEPNNIDIIDSKDPSTNLQENKLKGRYDNPIDEDELIYQDSQDDNHKSQNLIKKIDQSNMIHFTLDDLKKKPNNSKLLSHSNCTIGEVANSSLQDLENIIIEQDMTMIPSLHIPSIPYPKQNKKILLKKFSNNQHIISSEHKSALQSINKPLSKSVDNDIAPWDKNDTVIPFHLKNSEPVKHDHSALLEPGPSERYYINLSKQRQKYDEKKKVVDNRGEVQCGIVENLGMDLPHMSEGKYQTKFQTDQQILQCKENSMMRSIFQNINDLRTRTNEKNLINNPQNFPKNGKRHYGKNEVNLYQKYQTIEEKLNIYDKLRSRTPMAYRCNPILKKDIFMSKSYTGTNLHELSATNNVQSTNTNLNTTNESVLKNISFIEKNKAFVGQIYKKHNKSYLWDNRLINSKDCARVNDIKNSCANVNSVDNRDQRRKNFHENLKNRVHAVITNITPDPTSYNDNVCQTPLTNKKNVYQAEFNNKPDKYNVGQIQYKIKDFNQGKKFGVRSMDKMLFLKEFCQTELGGLSKTADFVETEEILEDSQIIHGTKPNQANIEVLNYKSKMNKDRGIKKIVQDNVFRNSVERKILARVIKIETGKLLENTKGSLIKQEDNSKKIKILDSEYMEAPALKTQCLRQNSLEVKNEKAKKLQFENSFVEGW